MADLPTITDLITQFVSLLKAVFDFFLEVLLLVVLAKRLGGLIRSLRRRFLNRRQPVSPLVSEGTAATKDPGHKTEELESVVGHSLRQ
jgi:hypothetical protein